MKHKIETLRLFTYGEDEGEGRTTYHARLISLIVIHSCVNKKEKQLWAPDAIVSGLSL